jgi:hypothetical protein
MRIKDNILFNVIYAERGEKMGDWMGRLNAGKLSQVFHGSYIQMTHN